MSSPEMPGAEPKALESAELVSYERKVGADAGLERDSLSFESNVAKVEIRTDMGGPESKYARNEDSAFLVSHKNTLNVGVIDGGGGGEGGGYKISVRVNQAFREVLIDGADLGHALDSVNRDISDIKENCFAAIAVMQAKKVEGTGEYDVADLISGDCEILTVRDGEALGEGTTVPQSNALVWMEKMGQPATDYYNHPNLHSIGGAIGPHIEKQATLPYIKKYVGKSGDISVIACDGVRDNISEYEILQIVNKHNGDVLAIEREIRDLAYERNNTHDEFIIQHDEKNRVSKRKYFPATPESSHRKRGDNITVAVVQLA